MGLPTSWVFERVAIHVAIHGLVNAIQTAPDLSDTAFELLILWSG